MVAIPADHSAQVQAALREIVAEYGRSDLTDPGLRSGPQPGDGQTALAGSSPGAVNLRVVGDQPARGEQPPEPEHWPWPWTANANRRSGNW
jgi:hypothetical protein